MTLFEHSCNHVLTALTEYTTLICYVCMMIFYCIVAKSIPINLFKGLIGVHPVEIEPMNSPIICHITFEHYGTSFECCDSYRFECMFTYIRSTTRG